LAEFRTVARVDDVEPGWAITVEVDGKGVALARLHDGSFRAIDDVCTHDGGPLGEGEVYENCIECPRHGAQFDLDTGEARTLPAVEGVNAYQVRVEGDEVQVAVGD
jgi:3-phenylpropionate/trans-cinnamate dioxygenase ferredoxin subunit